MTEPLTDFEQQKNVYVSSGYVMREGEIKMHRERASERVSEKERIEIGEAIVNALSVHFVSESRRSKVVMR